MAPAGKARREILLRSASPPLRLGPARELTNDAAGHGLSGGCDRGFLRPALDRAERLELFDWMAAWGLDTYVYAAKDDLKHRACWREPYAPSEARAIAVTD